MMLKFFTLRKMHQNTLKVLFLMLEEDGEDQFDGACDNKLLHIAKEQTNILQRIKHGKDKE
jgi:hypothetical protein